MITEERYLCFFKVLDYSSLKGFSFLKGYAICHCTQNNTFCGNCNILTEEIIKEVQDAVWEGKELKGKKD